MTKAEFELDWMALVIDALASSTSLKTFERFRTRLPSSSFALTSAMALPTTGASSTLETVTLTVIVSLKVVSSATFTTKLSVPLKSALGA